jgi:putative spermidine/putrescine transport system ATP-binding protein
VTSTAPSPVLAGPPALELEGLVKRFGSVTAVAGIHLVVRRGEFFTLLGPSGSGKTTILRLVAGFDRPTAGRILLEGRDISSLSPGQRGIGVVFQHYALFPHLTVVQNIRYPLKLRRWPPAETSRRIDEMLALVRLEGLGPRYPRELSGGQQQRVALARALAFRPALLLMDEPLGALDRTLRVEMEEEIRRIHREAKASVVYVTHDREEAFAMSDRIGVLRAGGLLQAGDARTLYETPADTFVARFFGDSLLLPVEAVLAESEGTARVRVLGRSFTVRRAAALGGGPPRLVVRPGQMRLSPAEDHLCIAAEVVDVVYLGETTQLRCQSPGLGQIVARVDPRAAADLQAGQQVRLGFAPQETVCVPDR